MTDITIPPEALEAVAKIIKDSFFTNDSDAENVARAACLAMLNAWPGMDTGPNIYGRQDAIIHLPLTENPDAEA